MQKKRKTPKSALAEFELYAEHTLLATVKDIEKLKLKRLLLNKKSGSRAAS